MDSFIPKFLIMFSYVFEHVCIIYRYLRILQTKGKEGFKLQLESCSYVGPVPYNFRDLGIIGQSHLVHCM